MHTMTEKLSLSIEATEQSDIFRAIVWRTIEIGYRPVTVIYDIGEGSLADLNWWFDDNHRQVRYVRLADGTLDEPDCLTVWEAAEAARVPSG